MASIMPSRRSACESARPPPPRAGARQWRPIPVMRAHEGGGKGEKYRPVRGDPVEELPQARAVLFRRRGRGLQIEQQQGRLPIGGTLVDELREDLHGRYGARGSGIDSRLRQEGGPGSRGRMPAHRPPISPPAPCPPAREKGRQGPRRVSTRAGEQSARRPSAGLPPWPLCRARNIRRPGRTRCLPARAGRQGTGPASRSISGSSRSHTESCRRARRTPGYRGPRARSPLPGRDRLIPFPGAPHRAKDVHHRFGAPSPRTPRDPRLQQRKEAARQPVRPAPRGAPPQRRLSAQGIGNRGIGAATRQRPFRVRKTPDTHHRIRRDRLDARAPSAGRDNPVAQLCQRVIVTGEVRKGEEHA